ncbi:MAG: RNA methyltransferase [Bacteroidales bacterium]|nr:RNA methyltransferase [Bacteroidales bacterium]
MLSKNNIKFINSLKTKKFRELHRKFIVEGDKITKELLESDYTVSNIFGKKEWLKKNTYEKFRNIEIIEVNDNELKKISSLTAPNQVLAIADIPDNEIKYADFNNDINIVLDDIQDPGNMGTILRTADWFGIKNIICSLNCVDIYNQKVIQASMGSIFRVNVYYMKLNDFLNQFNNNYSIIGTFTEGDNIYNTDLPESAFIIFGNEAKGINPKFEKFIHKKITIPNFNNSKTESLNVATSVAITCSEIRRRSL